MIGLDKQRIIVNRSKLTSCALCFSRSLVLGEMNVEDNKRRNTVDSNRLVNQCDYFCRENSVVYFFRSTTSDTSVHYDRRNLICWVCERMFYITLIEFLRQEKQRLFFNHWLDDEEFQWCLSNHRFDKGTYQCQLLRYNLSSN